MSLKELTENVSHTYEDLLEIEKKTGNRYELIDGELKAMATGTVAHALIIDSLSSLLKEKVDKNCKVFTGQIAVKSENNDFTNYYVPDVMVVCDKLSLSDTFVEKPSLIIEVTSPSTEKIDRTKKLTTYIKINGIKGYLVVRQDSRVIDFWHWKENVMSHNTFFEGDIVKIEDWLEFAVNDVYDGILE